MAETIEQQFAIMKDMFAPEPLHEDLVPYLGKGVLGQSLRHPLVFHVAYTETMNKLINQQYRVRVEERERFIREGNWSSFVFLHERAYRLNALDEVIWGHDVTDPKIVWPLVAETWTDSENIHENLDQWREMWDLDLPHRYELTMDDEDRAAFDALPEVIDVYRGVGHPDAVEGLSWTTDREKAVWFSRRFEGLADRTPILVSGKVEKNDVLAHLLGRGESEIVVLPENVMNVETTESR